MKALPEWVVAALVGMLSGGVLIALVLLGLGFLWVIYALFGSIWAVVVVVIIGLGGVVGVAMHLDAKDAIQEKRKNDDLSESGY